MSKSLKKSSFNEKTDNEVLRTLTEEEGRSEEEKSSIIRKVMFYLITKKIFRQKEVPKSAPDGRPHDLSDPSRFGLITTKHQHFFIPTKDGQLGAWYLEPEKCTATNDGKIVLYNHGVSKTRGGVNRVGLYNVLLKNGFSILTYDYRAFGDSSQTELTESTVVDDCLTAFAWLRQKVGQDTRILIWGHSMGTGITCHAMAKTFFYKGREDSGVAGVVLEAPYYNFAEELTELGKSVKNPFAKKALQTIYKSTGNKPIEKLVVELNISFESNKWIQNIKCPIMILHAGDDQRIPISQGIKLFEQAKAGGKTDIQFHKFDAHLGFAHSSIHRSKELPTLIENFYNTCEI